MLIDYTVFILYLMFGIICAIIHNPAPDENAVDWSQRSKCDSGSERKLFDALARMNMNVITQVPIGVRMRIDLFLPKYSLAVEVDSPFHDNPAAQARDRRKDRLIREKGWEVVRVRAEDISKDVNGVVRQVLAATDWKEIREQETKRRRVIARRFRVGKSTAVETAVGQARKVR